MRKTLFIIVMMITFMSVKAQDVKRTLGVGLQASLPSYGLSVKYALNEASVVQATIAPFSSGLYSINFYGARYVHRFPDSDQGKVSLDPYVFAGAGLLNYKTDLSMFGMGKTSDSFLGYSAGGGVELIVAKKLGISAELGYGKMGVADGIGVSSIFGGGGVHFYIF